MSELVQLQTLFQEYLFLVNEAIQATIVATEKVSVETRLAIYKNAYYARLLEALETTYPILKKYVGEEVFETIAYAYIHHHHSPYRSIRWFGDQLAIFLSEEADYRNSPHLSELAKFEWEMTLVFDAANADVISVEEIGKIPPDQWEDMQFKIHPSIHFLQLNWNVVAIWEALSEDKTPVAPVESESSVCWILWRKALVSRFCSLPEEEAWAMHALASGKSFGEICEGLCQWYSEEDAPLHAASLLKGWITAGLISCVYTKMS